jgi:hypothetical protein
MLAVLLAAAESSAQQLGEDVLRNEQYEGVRRAGIEAALRAMLVVGGRTTRRTEGARRVAGGDNRR